MSAVFLSVTSNIIQDRFPGRVVLLPEDVAEVWRGSRSSKAVGAIRKRLKRGTPVPGLKKNEGAWEVPVEGLVTALEKLMAGGEEEDAAPIHPQAAPPSGTRRCAIDPRMSDVVGFWNEVLRAMDANEAEQLRAKLGAAVMEWKWITTEEHEKMARQVLNDPPDKTYTDDDLVEITGRSVRTLRNWRNSGTGPKHTTKQVTKTVTKKRTLDAKYTEVVYSRDDLLIWIKSQELMEKNGYMLWNIDEIGRVVRDGRRDAGSLLDLLKAEHANRESLLLAMTLYRQQVADDLDDAAWRLAAMPKKTVRPHGL